MNDAHLPSLPVPSAKAVSRLRCEHVLALMLTQRGDPAAELDRLLADDPGCLSGHCLRAALIVRADEAASRSALVASLAVIEASSMDGGDPARRHAAAARAWLDGDSGLALARYGAIVSAFPRDAAALIVAHALDFRLGQRRMLRDRVARVLPHWNAGVPGFASVLAMQAFGLEENGQYRRAEKFARRAFALDPGHVGAMHALVHVLEMQGRAREGLAFLAANEPSWRDGNGFAIHLAWHRALFHLEMDDVEAALAVHDRQIAVAAEGDIAALTDASALLWRLELRTIDVGTRWQALADRWEAQPLALARQFHVVHAIIAFAAAGRSSASERVLAMLHETDFEAEAVVPPEQALVRPLCNAIVSFARRGYSECVEWLTRVRRIAYRCGGSIAQCDLIHLTFTEAALRARKPGLASSLVAERATRKPSSPLNRLLMRRAGMALSAMA